MEPMEVSSSDRISTPSPTRKEEDDDEEEAKSVTPIKKSAPTKSWSFRFPKNGNERPKEVDAFLKTKKRTDEADVLLCVGQDVKKKVPSHKALLMAYSTFFKEKLASKDKGGGKSKSIALQRVEIDVCPTVLPQLLDVLYSKEVALTLEQAKQLIAPATKLKIDYISNKCIEVISDDLSLDNCLEYVFLTSEAVNTKLNKLVLEGIFKKNLKTILKSKKFQNLPLEKIAKLVDNPGFSLDITSKLIDEWLNYDDRRSNIAYYTQLKAIELFRNSDKKEHSIFDGKPSGFSLETNEEIIPGWIFLSSLVTPKAAARSVQAIPDVKPHRKTRLGEDIKIKTIESPIAPPEIFDPRRKRKRLDDKDTPTKIETKVELKFDDSDKIYSLPKIPKRPRKTSTIETQTDDDMNFSQPLNDSFGSSNNANNNNRSSFNSSYNNNNNNSSFGGSFNSRNNNNNSNNNNNNNGGRRNSFSPNFSNSNNNNNNNRSNNNNNSSFSSNSSFNNNRGNSFSNPSTSNNNNNNSSFNNTNNDGEEDWDNDPPAPSTFKAPSNTTQKQPTNNDDDWEEDVPAPKPSQMNTSNSNNNNDSSWEPSNNNTSSWDSNRGSFGGNNNNTSQGRGRGNGGFNNNNNNNSRNTGGFNDNSSSVNKGTISNEDDWGDSSTSNSNNNNSSWGESNTNQNDAWGGSSSSNKTDSWGGNNSNQNDSWGGSSSSGDAPRGRGGGDRGRGRGGRGGNNNTPRDGDWKCEKCGFPRNFAFKTDCYKCQEPKPAGLGGSSSNSSFGGRGRGGDRGRGRGGGRGRGNNNGGGGSWNDSSSRNDTWGSTNNSSTSWGGSSNNNTVQADEDDWDTPSTSSAKPAAPVQQQTANKVADDDDWDTPATNNTTTTTTSTINAPAPAKPIQNTDDGWDTPVHTNSKPTIISKPPIQNQPKTDDWDSGPSSTPSVPVNRPAPVANNWNNTTTPVSVVRNVPPPQQQQKTTTVQAVDDDDWE